MLTEEDVLKDWPLDTINLISTPIFANALVFYNLDIFVEKCNSTQSDKSLSSDILLLSKLVKEKPESYSNNGIYNLVAHNLKDILKNLDIDESESLVCSIVNKEINQNDKLNWIKEVISYANGMISENSANNKPEIKVRLLNQYPNAAIKDFRIVKDILAESYSIKITQEDDYDIVIDGVFGRQPVTNKNAYKIFINGEPVPSRVGGYDLSLGFDYFVHQNYLRYPLYYAAYGDLVDSKFTRVTECNPNKSHFACFLVSNAASGDGAIARGQMFHDLSTYKKVSSGGKHLNNMGRIIPSNETYDFLSQCKFIIAYESFSTYAGYMSEKLFQAYFSGSVPLYYSDIQVQSEVNKNAMISRQDFQSNQDMINYIAKVDQDDQLYCKIWNNSIINDPRRNYQEIKRQVRAKMKGIIYVN